MWGNFQKVMFKTKESRNVNINNKVQKTMIKVSKTKVVLCVSVSRKKEWVIVIATMNCYPKNG